jgi:outer membrane protein assembly factor BamB
MKLQRLLIASVLCLTFLSGCSWLGNKDDAALEPAELVKFEQTVALNRLWSANVGSAARKYWANLEPAASSDTLFASDHEGKVTALDASSGKRRWSVDLEIPVSGGVGYGAGLVMLGTLEGQIYALDAEDGSLFWTSEVSSEVVSSPVANNKIVVAHTIDNRIFALDASTGEALWQHDGGAPILSVRGTSTSILLDNMVISALDSGKLIAFNPDNGSLIWETRLALPKGRTELERMIDIDGKPLLVEDIIYAVSYQGRLGALTRGTGRKLWFQDSSSHHSPAHGDGKVFVSEAGGTVRAFQAGSGQVVWTNEQLFLRGLTGPVQFADTVAVADAEGYLHLLDIQDGSFVGRIKVDGSGVSSPLLVVGEQLLVQANDGSLTAYKIR